MQIRASLDAVDSQGRSFLTWTPRKLEIALDDDEGNSAREIIIESVGQVPLSISGQRSVPGATSVTQQFSSVPSTIVVWVAGVLGNPSVVYGDAEIEIRARSNGQVLWSQNAMVRIRKNAEALTDPERDAFLNALAVLNDAGNGPFSQFRDTHTNTATLEAHFDAGFLPWHRAYMIDLERELQAIDPEVSLHYWRFDQAAPYLFTQDFIGLPDRNGVVRFSPGHPLNSWTTNGQLGISRRMPRIRPNQPPPGVLSEAATLALGNNGRRAYSEFVPMEGNPHGSAHTRFDGYLSRIPTAARDPLFFMLHCNVDRLWAKWQVLYQRHDPGDMDAYMQPFGTQQVGHHLNDTMWPWNGDTSSPRPPTAPRTPLATSTVPNSLPSAPRIIDMIDYSGAVSGDGHGFHYDDVPFDHSFAQPSGGMV